MLQDKEFPTISMASLNYKAIKFATGLRDALVKGEVHAGIADSILYISSQSFIAGVLDAEKEYKKYFEKE